MAMSEQERQILDELERQFDRRPALSWIHGPHPHPRPQNVARLGWLTIVAGLVMMIATLAVSFVVAFLGCLLLFGGVVLVLRYGGKGSVAGRVRRWVDRCREWLKADPPG